MKRRNFLKTVAPAAVLPSLVDQLSVKAFSREGMLGRLFSSTIPNDHVLVMIFLNGGNDGLNTVVPLDQMSQLAAARPDVLLPENQLHTIPDKQIGLHPSLGHFKTLYDEQKLQIIQSVGYPQPNFSHFRSTDIWVSGSDADQYVNSGWMGRFLEENFPGYPSGYPNPDNPDPLAIQLGTNLPLLFQGNAAQMAFNVSSPDIFNVNVDPTSDPAPDTPAGEELTYIRNITGQINNYAANIINAYVLGDNAYGGYPAPGVNYLADTLKSVARLIKGGLQSRIYLVSIGGFDTHAAQVENGDTTTGMHANLLQLLNDGVFAFQRDLEALGLADRVMGMTFSEFGRRIISNGSMGTDHGAAAPLFLFGTQVASGVLGDNPTIPAGASPSDNLPMQYDFRSVYASVLRDWFCMDQSVTNSILLDDFQALPVIQNMCSVSVDDPRAPVIGLQLAPNPMVDRTQALLELPGGKTRIELFDPLGRVVWNRHLGRLAPGPYTVDIENPGYPPGNYYVRVQCGSFQQVTLLSIVR